MNHDAPLQCKKATEETICLAGETVALLPERALYWQSRRVLVIADPHFGKIASFQHQGVPLPAGVMADDLARLDRALAATKAVRLVILGDFFHTAASQAESVLAALATWRAHHRELHIDLVPGNHDRHAGAPPPSLEIVERAEGWAMGPFRCRHALPDASAHADEGYVLAGHVHPIAVLRDVDGSRHRFPCFWVRPTYCLLPAFTDFAGGQAVRARREDRVYVVYEERIRQVSG